MEDNTRTKILETATKLFVAKGFDGVSIREICKNANVNISMISYYFGSKKELYQAIIDDKNKKITEYTKTYMDINQDISILTKKEQINLLYLILNKCVDYFYSSVSNDHILFIIQEQYNAHAIINSVLIAFIRKLIAGIFDKKDTDKEIIFKTTFILSLINSPRIMPALTIKLLGQNEFIQEDIEIIKKNLMLYVNTLLKEAGID